VFVRVAWFQCHAFIVPSLPVSTQIQSQEHLQPIQEAFFCSFRALPESYILTLVR
jgi:hypothetical protein